MHAESFHGLLRNTIEITLHLNQTRHPRVFLFRHLTMVNRCLHCNAIDSLVHITSRACDGNYIVYPNGHETSGYLPSVAGLCESDGLMISICIACGQLSGLDRVALREIFSQPLDEQ